MKANRFYVKAVTGAGRVTGYGVYDCVGGMESEHARYMIEGKHRQTVDVCLYLANQHRDDMNAETAPLKTTRSRADESPLIPRRHD